MHVRNDGRIIGMETSGASAPPKNYREHLASNRLACGHRKGMVEVLYQATRFLFNPGLRFLLTIVSIERRGPGLPSLHYLYARRENRLTRV